MALLPVTEAQTRLLHRTREISDADIVPLMDAAGRTLAADIKALMTQPPFNASAMDGYALRAADADKIGSTLQVIGTSSAGHAFSGSVGTGQAVRIFTGAPVPDGADSILIQEDAERLADGSIRTMFEIIRGRHIRPRGQDFAEGEIIARDGDRIDFGLVTLIAATNHADVPVYRRAKVAILATGDELLPPGSQPGPSQIIGSNSFGIAALARDCGAEIIDLGIVPDDSARIAAKVEEARTAGADILVTLGGASVGDHDLVQSTLISCGMVLDFWRIAMRPGKPLMVGTLGDMHVLGLPGNPVSSMVCGLLFLEPMLLKMARRTPHPRMAQAITATGLPANDKRQDYLRATLTLHADGRQLVTTGYGRQDSSMMKVFARSDCLIVRPPEAPPLAAGEPCPILLLRPVAG